MEITFADMMQTDLKAQQPSQKAEDSTGVEFEAVIEDLLSGVTEPVETASDVIEKSEAKGIELTQTAILNAPVFKPETTVENVSTEDTTAQTTETPDVPALFIEAEKTEKPAEIESDSDDEEAATPVFVHTQASALTIQPVVVNAETGVASDEARKKAPVQELSIEGVTSKAKPQTESQPVEQNIAQVVKKEGNEERAEVKEVKSEKAEEKGAELTVQPSAEKVETKSENDKGSFELSSLKEFITKEDAAKDNSFGSEKQEKKEAFSLKETASPESSEGVVERTDDSAARTGAVPFAAAETETGNESPFVNAGGAHAEGKEVQNVHGAAHTKETAHAKASAEPVANNNHVQHVKEVYEKFGEGVKVSLAENGKEVRLSLHPEDLGHLQIKLKVEDSLVKAHILVDSAAVKSVFDADSSRLKEVFAGHGLTLDKCSVELNMNSRQFENSSTNGSSWDGQFGGKREQSPSFWHKEEAKELKQYVQSYNARKGQGGVDIFA